jgi:hypothetical protein
VHNLTPLTEETEKKHGKVLPIGHQIAWNEDTKTWNAVPDYFIDFPGLYRKDLWDEIGMKPDTWEDIRIGGAKLKQKGFPLGIAGVCVVAITLLIALPAGYSLARMSGRGAESLGIGIFLTYLVPPTLLFLPLSRVVSELGLQDTLWSLVLVYPTFTIPYCTWLFMGFFKSVPREIEKAAIVDGCTVIGAFVKTVLPLSTPASLPW